MKTTYIFSLIFFASFILSAQNVSGKWITMDENGNEKAIISVFEDTGIVYGKIIDILDSKERKALCTNCKGEDISKPLVGLMIIKDLKSDGTYYRGGSILNTETGEIFKCRLSIPEDKPNTLEVRSYLAFDYKTQYWKRMSL